MIRKLAVASALILLPTVVQAQGGGAGEAERNANAAIAAATTNVAQVLIDKKADLALSDEVVTKIEAIKAAIDKKNEAFVAEYAKVREAGGTGQMDDAARQAFQAKVAAARQANDEAWEKEIKPLLTPEQATKATEAINAARQPQQGRGG
jgi:hypothetical protein